jgi:uncharacterized OB-fold protein
MSQKSFSSLTPYPYAIVRLKEGVQIGGIIKDVELNNVRIGLEVEVDFERLSCTSWPSWGRLYFHFLNK